MAQKAQESTENWLVDADEVDSRTGTARVFTDTDLRGIDSFEAAIQAAERQYGAIVEASDEIGSGFVILENKDRLIDNRFIILHMTFPTSKTYRNPDTGEYVSFVSCHIVTANNERYILIDGGAGIYAQLDEWSVRSNRSGGLVVNGLRKSEYDLPDGSGKGTTYYLNV